MRDGPLLPTANALIDEVLGGSSATLKFSLLLPHPISIGPASAATTGGFLLTA